jgi:hypothetical protein
MYIVGKNGTSGKVSYCVKVNALSTRNGLFSKPITRCKINMLMQDQSTWRTFQSLGKSLTV